MLTLFAQRAKNAADADAAAGLGLACFATFGLVFLVFFVLIVAIMWKVFAKAGQPGWAALVPFYNSWILITEICKKEPLWFILSLFPFVNIIASWVICQELARKFGKSDAFGIGLFFLGPIFLAMLAFGDARYEGGRSKRYDDDDDDRPRKRSRDDEDDDEDEDDRPRRKKRRSNDDDD